MENSRPKFCVGELVEIVSVLRPDLNCTETEVLKADHFNGTEKQDLLRAMLSHHSLEPAIRSQIEYSVN